LVSLDGAFVSTGAAPRVRSMREPVVFVRYGREGALAETFRVSGRNRVANDEFSRLRTRWRANNLLLQDYDAPAGITLSRMEGRKKGKGGVRFRAVGEVSPAAKS